MISVNSDWEGPWVTADHAFDVCKEGIPEGDRLFSGISEYDDYLAYVRKKEGYEPGDTLALIAPFLIAFDLSEAFLVKVAEHDANFIEGSLKAIKLLTKRDYDFRVVSTSYCQYVAYTTNLAGIREGKIRCTSFPINKFSKIVTETDKKLVRKQAEFIKRMPKLGINASTTKKDLNSESLSTIRELDQFFWAQLPKTSFQEVLNKVKPLGGRRKLKAIVEILREEGKELNESVTIGDSITDWAMLSETKQLGGLAISFNGNDYAIRNANVAIISNNCLITPIVVDVFRDGGIEGVKTFADNWDPLNPTKALKAARVDSLAANAFLAFRNRSRVQAEIVWIDDDNVEATIQKSKRIRKAIRGVAIGSLG